MDEHHGTKDVSHDNPGAAHETRDINVRIVVGFAVSLVIAAILIHVLVWLLFDVYGGLQTAGSVREFPLAQTGEVRLPPSPRLQDKPREDLKALRRQEDELLNSYTWLNQQMGAVRIPIGEAMKMVMQQGFPVVERPAPEPGGVPASSSPERTPDSTAKR